MTQPFETSATWCLVHTQPHGERKAVAHLQRQGFSIYQPRYLRRHRHARRVTMAPSALFPRYVFVAIDVMAQRWRAVRSTVGVSHLVCRGDEPAVVPAGIVEQLRVREDANGFICLDQRPQFKPGDQVRVENGPFEDRLGLFEGLTDGDRVRILLDLLGRKVRVMLDADELSAA